MIQLSLTNDRLTVRCQAFKLAYQLQIESIDQHHNHDHYPAYEYSTLK
jgi:hypothetical protein